MPDSAVLCAHHPQRRARTACSRCGAPLCGRCRRIREGATFCRACLAAGAAEAAAPAALAPREADSPPAAPPAAPPGQTDREGPAEAAPAALAPREADSPPAAPPAAPPGQTDREGPAKVAPVAPAAVEPAPPAPVAAGLACEVPSAGRPDAPAAAAVFPAPEAPASGRPVSPAGPPAFSAPRGLLLLVGLQTAATLLAAWAAWRAAGSMAASLRGPIPAPSKAPSAPAPALAAPSLDLRPGTVLRGSPVRLQGAAPGAELAILLGGGRPLAAALVVSGRFAFEEVALPAGDIELSVLAQTRAGASAESPRVPARYEVLGAPLAAPTASPTPAGER